MDQQGGEAEIAIKQAALDIKPLNTLIPGRPFYSFRIIGADLALVRSSDGRYELSGLGVSGRGGGSDSGLRKLASVGEVRLQDSNLTYDDAERGISLEFSAVGGRVQLDGLRLAAEVHARITDPQEATVLGDFDTVLLIQLDEEKRLASADWHLTTREMMVSSLVHQLPSHPLAPESGWLNAELWGDWSRDEDLRVTGVLDLRDSVLATEPETLSVQHFNSRFRWQSSTKNTWRLDLADLTVEDANGSWNSERVSLKRDMPQKLGLWVSADEISLALPLSVTRRSVSAYHSRWPHLMPKSASGRVEAFDLVLNDRWRPRLIQGNFDNVNLYEWDRWPDVTGIDGRVSLQHGEGEVEVTGSGVGIHWPRNFREPLIVDVPACSIDLALNTITPAGREIWQTDVHDCVLRRGDMTIDGRVRVQPNSGKPSMDINARVSNAKVTDLDDYWPEAVMPPSTVRWLRRGLVAGTLTEGRFSVRGDMDDWPFLDGQGQFQASTRLNGIELDYVDGWPNARGINGEAEFEGVSMDVRGTVDSLAGVPVQRAHARIANFYRSVLELDYQSDTTLPALTGFIRRSPLMDNIELDPERFVLSGNASTRGSLRAPLHRGGGDLSVNGQLTLDGNQFESLDSGVVLDQITGGLTYDTDGFHGSGLTTVYEGTSADLELTADWDAPVLFQADLAGMFPIGDLVPDLLMQNEPVFSMLEGACDWNASLRVESRPGRSGRETWLELTSDLVGVDINLPAPFNKVAGFSWPVQVRYPVKSPNPIVDVSLAGRGSLQLDMSGDTGSPRRSTIQFGNERPTLPAVGYFGAGGDAEMLDLDAWLDFVIERAQQDSGIGNLLFESASVHAHRMTFLNRVYEDVGIHLWMEGDIIRIRFDGENIAGSARYTRGEGMSHSLTAEFDRLILGEALSEGVTMGADPTSFPEIHLYAHEFHYLGLEFGETRIEGYPKPGGYRIESVEAASDQFVFQARGDWLSDSEGMRSDFNIHMTSESLGSLLDALGVSAVMEGGQTILSFDAWWPGPPAAFALSRLNGEMETSIIDGRILDAEAGAGRLLGLMSVAALPRRLALDFRDVFGSGFNFDLAGGRFTLENGTASTEDFSMKSTAATISVAGSNDLVDKVFDYVITVRPGVGGTLPVIGAIAGGPGGAAAGLALQGLLQKSLGDATQVQYSMVGSWSDPQIEPLQPLPEKTPDE
jgi:uncharacterized protein (TIGR02099 family)